MLEVFGLTDSAKMIVFLMLSLSFFVGIMLVVSQEAFHHFNEALRREFGLKRRIVPKIENTQFHFVDWLILKYRFVAGMFITITSFILLLLYK